MECLTKRPRVTVTSTCSDLASWYTKTNACHHKCVCPYLTLGGILKSAGEEIGAPDAPGQQGSQIGAFSSAVAAVDTDGRAFPEQVLTICSPFVYLYTLAVPSFLAWPSFSDCLLIAYRCTRTHRCVLLPVKVLCIGEDPNMVKFIENELAKRRAGMAGADDEDEAAVQLTEEEMLWVGRHPCDLALPPLRICL